MQIPKTPKNEFVRLKALKEYSILDTLPEEEYDNITRLASRICGTSISTISLIDENRQWFKSKTGTDVEETARSISFCAHAIAEPDKILMVNDSRLDSRFMDSPLVVNDPHIVFYTGIPLVSPQGLPLGTLCVMDYKPKALDKEQLEALKALSNQVVSLFELRKNKMMLERLTQDLKTRNAELEKFAHVAAHDIKSPLSNISSLIQLLISQYSENQPEEAKMLMTMLDASSTALRNLVDGILEHSKSDSILVESRKAFDIRSLVKETIQLLDNKNKYQFLLPFESKMIFTNRIALQQILINLVVNGIKYNDKDNVIIEIGFKDEENFYEFTVSDNGSGIKEENQQKIFDIFETLSNEDRFGNKGNGIGLSTVKKLVEGLGGEIKVYSQVEKGTKFVFTISKSDFV